MLKTLMSNTALLIFVTLTCVSTKSAAQVVCVNPMQIDELRVLNSKACFDVDGSSGAGNALTFRCSGREDQQIISCGDGTIRNKQAPYNCLTTASTDGTGNLFFSSCKLLPAIPDYQKWRYGNSKTFVDNGGIQQVARQIINLKSGLCVDVEGIDGTGNIGAYSCDGRDDQYFYFRSRGKQLAHGRLQNEKSGLCLDPHGSSAGREANILIFHCEDLGDQFFSYYENGELVNQKSRLCVDVRLRSGSGNINLFDCEDEPDQMWSQPRQYCLGDYCSFYNKKSGLCMDTVGLSATSGSNVVTYNCEGAPDQLFRWVTEKWVTPTASWNLVGCNQNGKVTQTISNTVTYTSVISTSTTIEISSTIEAGVIFGSASVETSVATSLATEWEDSQSVTQAISFTCESYDSGKEFTRGCMWQLQLDTKQSTNDDPLTWAAQIVKCTSNHEAPKCPPFTMCKDDACTMCEKFSGARKKKSIEALTWKKVLKIE